MKEEFDHERFIVALTNYGTAFCAFEDAAHYANQRVPFGEAIGRFQLFQEKFAHMAIKLNSMKNMLFEAAWKSDNGLMTSGDAAMCKYFCANAAFEVVDSAMQVLGGVGEDWQAITCPVMAVGGWADSYSNAVFRLMDNLDVPRKAILGSWANIRCE